MRQAACGASHARTKLLVRPADRQAVWQAGLANCMASRVAQLIAQLIAQLYGQLYGQRPLLFLSWFFLWDDEVEKYAYEGCKADAADGYAAEGHFGAANAKGEDE